jgi:hypothetical protein
MINHKKEALKGSLVLMQYLLEIRELATSNKPEDVGPTNFLVV